MRSKLALAAFPAITLLLFGCPQGGPPEDPSPSPTELQIDPKRIDLSMAFPDPPDAQLMDAQYSPSACLRVATFNTQCIVPVMDPEFLSKVYGIDQIALNCLQDVADLLDPLSGIWEAIEDLNPVDFKNNAEDQVKGRAHQIVNLIKTRPDYDILVLNEVFLDEARDILYSELQGTFPYCVKKLSGGGPCLANSGLMLFSRYPIVTPPASMLFFAGGEIEAYAAGQSISDRVRFVVYPWDACIAEDCLADKGVGYVRIERPGIDSCDVFFTHLQADPELWGSELDVWTSRSAQLNTIRQMIEMVMLDGNDCQNVLVMGDLNIYGTQWAAAQAKGIPFKKDRAQEYDSHFAPGGGWVPWWGGDPFSGADYTHGIVYDAWGRTSSPSDPGCTQGYTSGGITNRLDYLLMKRPPGPLGRELVAQHMTIRSDPGISDHMAVHAELNNYQPHCTPADAFTPQQPDPSQWENHQKIEHSILVPGGCHWYRLDLPGTYTFSIFNHEWALNENSGFRLRVYTATDLTNDVANYYGEETDITEFLIDVPKPAVGKKYVLPAAPFYVQVSSEDPFGNGLYRLFVHLHEGASKNDAIVIPVGTETPYVHPGKPINPEDMAWFQVNLEVADSGKPQTANFLVSWDPQKGKGPMTLWLQSEDPANSVVSKSNVVEGSPPGVWPQQFVSISKEGLEQIGTRLYLRVQRPVLPEGAIYDAYSLYWTTNLTILYGNTSQWGCPSGDLACEFGKWPYHLICGDETGSDWAGSDEIGIRVYADDVLVTQAVPNQVGGQATDMDSGDGATLGGVLGPIRFVESVYFTVIEYDGSDEDVSGGVKIPFLYGWGGIVPPPAESLGEEAHIGVDDGDYYFRYNRRRTFQVPSK